MSWDFETEPEFQKELDWIDRFVREEVEPLDYVLGHPYDVRDAKRNALVRPPRPKSKSTSCGRAISTRPRRPRLRPNQAGPDERNSGRSRFAPIVFGCRA